LQQYNEYRVLDDISQANSPRNVICFEILSGEIHLFFSDTQSFRGGVIPGEEG